MLTPRARRAFINRERVNYSKYKNYDDAKLTRLRKRLRVRPPIWNKLRKHQRVCFLLGARFGSFCFWNDTGTGKSLLSIALIRYYEFLRSWEIFAGHMPAFSKPYQALVLVPNKINKTEWARELRKHSPKTKYVVLKGSSAQKWDLINQYALERIDQLAEHKVVHVDEEKEARTVFVETYGGFVRLACKREKIKKTARRKKGKRKLRLVPDRKRVETLAAVFDGLYLDESGAIGSHDSLPFRIIKKLSQSAQNVFPLNGTPFGRDPEPLWAQMYVVDKGHTLGETLGLFRSVFYRDVEQPSGFPKPVFRKRRQKLLNLWIRNRSIRYEVKDSDLPAVVPITKKFAISAEAKHLYEAALKAIAEKRRDKQQVQNQFLRLRQLSSGFLGYKDEAGARAQIAFPYNPKLETCLSLAQEIVRGYKVIIFHDFTYSGNVISAGLKKLGIPHSRIWGGTKDPDYEYAEFVDGPKPVFLLQSAAGAKGLNLQCAKYGIFYESPVPFIIRRQGERRFIRQESLHEKVVMYDLIMSGGVDQRILDMHKEGGDLLKAVLDGTVELGLKI